MSTRVLHQPLGARTATGAGALALGAGVAGLSAAGAVTAGPAVLGIPAALAVVVFLVRRPLALLALYTYIGLYKGQGIVDALPVDATLALGLLLVSVCFFRWASGRARRIPFGLLAPLVVIGSSLLVSLSWTPAAQYGGEKALRFVTLTLLAALAPFVVIEDARDIRSYLSWTVVIALISAVLAVLNPPAETGRLTIGSAGNTIGVSHLLCVGALILLVCALTDLISARGWAIAASFALIGVAAAVGSRGPLLSFAFALVVTGAVWLARVPRKVLPVLLVVGVGIALSPFVSLPQGSAERLGEAFRDPVAALRGDARYTTFGQAMRLIEQHPVLGVGSGGFQTVGTLAHPPEDYPHNMLLEVWSELGLVAAALLVVSIATVLVALWRAAWRAPPDRSRGLVYVIVAVFLFNLSAAQLSGDLNQNRTFWSAFGLAWLVAMHGVGRGERRSRAEER